MLDLQVPERLAGNIRTGMAIEIAVPGADGAIVGGTIISVGASLDPATRSILAKARVGAAPQLIAGKNVMVVIKGDGSQTGVQVPVKAVTQIDNKDVVFVFRGDTVERREIVIVSRTQGFVVISQGVAVGEQVAVSGLSELKVMLAGE